MRQIFRDIFDQHVRIKVSVGPGEHTYGHLTGQLVRQHKMILLQSGFWYSPEQVGMFFQYPEFINTLEWLDFKFGTVVRVQDENVVNGGIVPAEL